METLASTGEVPSPFIKGTLIQYAWDSTSLGWLKECPRKYYYQMIVGYRSRKESVHLRWGSHYHAALELYDKLTFTGVDHQAALEQVVGDLLAWTWEYSPDGSSLGPWEPDHKLKTRYNLLRSVVWYLDQFFGDRISTVKLADGKPAVELSFRLSLDENLMICGHLDRVVNFMDGQFVMDHKTTTTTPGEYYFNQFNPDNQMSLYSVAASTILQAPVKGVIVMACQVAVGFTRFERGLTYRSEEQMNEWVDNLHWWARQQRLMDTAAAKLLHKGQPIREAFPMNDKSCHDYGGCPFREICARPPTSRDQFLDAGFDKIPWNPLIVR